MDQLVNSLGLLFGLALGIPLLIALGRLLSPRQSRVLPVLLPIGFVVALFLGTSLYLDRAGSVTGGHIIIKRESIPSTRRFAAAPLWLRAFTVAVHYHAAGRSEPVITDLRVSERDYDQLHVGTPVDVRYLPIRPSIARLVGQSTATWLQDVMQPRSQRTAELWLGALVAAALWLVAWLRQRGPGRWWLASMASVLWLAAFGLTITQRTDGAPSGETRLVAVARVRRIAEVLYGSWIPGWVAYPYRRLAYPYRRVETLFVPRGLGDTVMALDDIDPASAARLAVGGPTVVAYSPSHPRQATIRDATRTFAERNRTASWIGNAEGAAVIVGVLALLAILRGTVHRAGRRWLEKVSPPRSGAES
ncbi:MAG: hypothetical protein M3Z54_10810 [Gemmatimonadota bacterium]|nr:hypothetical protein [Gemmatimonadota bacterium]